MTRLWRFVWSKAAKMIARLKSCFAVTRTLCGAFATVFYAILKMLEDMTQEIFLRVYRSLASFEGRSSLKTWIYRIAINTCQNEIRRRKRRPQLAETDMQTVAEYLPSTTTTEREWQKRHLQGQLTMAFSQLRPDEFDILTLRDVEERPYTEIAEMLSINLSAAKMRAKRARESLKLHLYQLSGGEFALS